MVGEEIMSNVSSNVMDLVIPAMMEKLEPFIAIFKIAGIALLAYVLYLFIRIFFNWRFRKRVKRMEKKLNCMDEKLNSVLKLLEKEKKKKKKK